jgi:hypothetical protein
MATKLPKEITKTLKVDLHISGIAGMVFAIFLIAAVVGALLMDGKAVDWLIGTYVLGLTLIGSYILYALKVASQWQKAIILRLGRFHKLAGPGLFWIVPIIDTLPSWIDHRVMVSPFAAEKTLTERYRPRSCSGSFGMPRKPLWKWRITRRPSRGPHRPPCARSSGR